MWSWHKARAITRGIDPRHLIGAVSYAVVTFSPEGLMVSTPPFAKRHPFEVVLQAYRTWKHLDANAERFRTLRNLSRARSLSRSIHGRLDLRSCGQFFVWDFSVIGHIAHFEQFIGPSQVIYVFEYLLWGLTAAYFWSLRGILLVRSDERL